jgi:formylglycine-generating enzyme required for sulfatase activity
MSQLGSSRHTLAAGVSLALMAAAWTPLAGCRKGGEGQAGAKGRHHGPYYRPGLAAGPTVRVAHRYGGAFGAGPQGRVDPYDIDRAPVSQGRYQAWLATHPSPKLQGAPCHGNTSFAPERSCLPKFPTCTGGHCPVVCVDWCDARAYCEAVGKHLCGRIGGGASPWRSYRDPAVSQWYNACLSQNSPKAPRLTFASVWEWVDSCQGSDADSPCRTRPMSRGLPGRHDAYGAAHHNCGAANGYGRLTRWSHVGFRCCR